MAGSTQALRARLALALFEHPSDGLRLRVAVVGEAAAPPRVAVPGALGTHVAVAPLRAARVVQLVGAHTRHLGTRYHPVSKMFSFALEHAAAVAAALARPLSVLPRAADLYATHAPALPPGTDARRPGESDYAATARRVAALRDACAYEYTQLGAASISVDTLPTPVANFLAVPANRRCMPSLAASAVALIAIIAGVPPALWAKLFPFQRAGVAFMAGGTGRALLGDEMGCGKTLQGVALVLHFLWRALADGAAPHAVVVVPASLKEQWRREFAEWAADASVVAHHGAPLTVAMPANGAAPIAARGVTVLSYDVAARPEMLSRLLAARPCVVVVDESHYIKTPTARRTRAVAALAHAAPHALALSGTPMPNRPIELFIQLNIIAPRLFPDMHAFGVRYCDAQMRTVAGRDTWEYRGATNGEELRLLMRRLMVRRLKSEVLSQLPPKMRERVFLTLDAVSRGEVAAMRAHAAEVRAGGNELAANAALLAAVQHTGRVKLPAVRAYLDEAVLGRGGDDADAPRPPKFLVFAHHREVLDAIEAHLRTRGLATIRIDGDVPPEQRAVDVARFQDPAGGIDAAILSINAAGVGLTLTAATLVLFAELYWNHATLNQCEDRAHRIGQTAPVTIRYLLAPGTTDEHVWSVISAKFTTTGAIMNGCAERLTSTASTFESAAERAARAADVEPEAKRARTEPR